MDDRRPTPAQRRAPVEGGNGYPLREEATEPFPPAPLPATPAEPTGPVEEEIYAAPVEPVSRRRSFLPGANPWPLLLAVLILLAGLGIAYAVTRPGNARHPGGGAAANAAAAPAPPPAPASSPTPRSSPPSTPAPTAPPASASTRAAPTAPQPAAAPRPSTVSVPSLVGASLARAVFALKQAKLTAVVSHVASNAPTGRVVVERPAAGAKVPQGGRVGLSVSVQPLVAVPDVTGMQGLTAVHTLQGDHLVASIRYVPSTKPARRVVSQWPPAGNKVHDGTTVRLNLSQGLRPSAAVPNVVGEDEATARTDLGGAGFTVRSVDSTTNDPGQDGVVVDERPGGGTNASRGATVTINVGRYSNG